MDNIKAAYQSWYMRPLVDFTVPSARRAIRQHESGVFTSSGALADQMYRDDRIRAALNTRINGLLGLPVEMRDPTSGKEVTSAIAKQAKADAGNMLPRLARRRLLRFKHLMGFAVAELIWDTTSDVGKWTPRIRVWHPSHFEYREDLGALYANTQAGQVAVNPGQGKWAVWGGVEEAPWEEGLVRALAIPWLIRQFAYRDWARNSEVHGLPIRKATVPQDADAATKANFLRSIAQAGRAMTVEVPSLRDDQGKFDLELIEAASQSYEGFRALLSACESSIAIAILGQNLTTEVKGGSLAAAKVHDSVRLDYVYADAHDEAEGVAQVLYPWALYNYGEAQAKALPRYTVEADPPADLKTDAETLRTFAQGLNLFGQAGYEVDNLDEVAERFGVDLKPVPKVYPAAKPPEAPGTGQQQDDPTLTPEDPAAPEIRASGKAGGAFLASGASTKGADGFVSGQLYADAVTDYAVTAAASALAPDLAQVVEAVQTADSYDDLRSKLVTLYAGASPDALAGIMEKAIMLANMAGRLAVIQDL